MSALSKCTSKCNENFSDKYLCDVLNSKEIIFKHKCTRDLKRKLKKYKLRRDGKEDQDVLYVSKTLLTSLKIKSPNSDKENNRRIVDMPKNYLSKMLRKHDVVENVATTSTNSPNFTNYDVGVSVNGTNNINIGNDFTNQFVYISQEKKHTNAFKFMMESRNKSIGSNSPGKEKSVSENKIEENAVKKDIKAKRNLVLQKMAEAKGALKKMQMEEYREQIIKVKMEKRAERLKNMVLAKNSKDNTAKNVNKISKNKPKKKINLPHHVEPKKEDNNVTSPKNLHIVDLFNEADTIYNKEYLESKEDDDFLNKLSPSIRKKENMLCYFKKVEKDAESPLKCVNDDIIKVKMTSKAKKKTKKGNVLHKESKPHQNDMNLQAITKDINKNDEALSEKETYIFPQEPCKKRKRKKKAEGNSCEIECDMGATLQVYEGRPKRHIKKPLKYKDEVQLSSSDEEYNIFTPKKKKIVEETAQVTNCRKEHTSLITKNSSLQKQSNRKLNKELPKKSFKLAPIFAIKQNVDSAVVEARQKFLFSGIPEQLKKNALHKNVYETLTSFNKVVHVQQVTDSSIDVLDQPIVDLLINDSNDEIVCNFNNADLLRTLIQTNNNNNNRHGNNSRYLNSNIQEMLQHIKQTYPRFPVYRTYRLLKNKSKGDFTDIAIKSVDLNNSVEIVDDLNDIKTDNPDYLNWTDKYKAMSAEQVLGNFDNVKELKKWLQSWTENVMYPKYKDTTASDSSDFYDSDTDSRDSMKSCNNLLIISGPTGSGKTSSVYAVAADLAIKVIEVNVSSKRTGKIMLQDLQEATQSHKVNRGKGSSTENSQDVPLETLSDVRKYGKKNKTLKAKNMKLVSTKSKHEICYPVSNSQELLRTGMSLILIDDADIVFDQDDGFYSAITQLVQSSKRPVILVTTTLKCPHVRKFVQIGKTIHMNSLSPKILGTWLDIMCLADCGLCCPGTGEILLESFNGDIRKSINFLQFYMITARQSDLIPNTVISKNDDCMKYIDDESSNTSWIDHDNVEEKVRLCDTYTNLKYSVPLLMKSNSKCDNMFDLLNSNELVNIWWSFSRTNDKSNDVQSNQEKDNKNEIMLLENIANKLDNISLSNYYTCTQHKNNINVDSRPWYSFEYDTVSERENFDTFNRSFEITREISHYLISQTLNQDQNHCEINLDFDLASMTQSRERNRIVQRHQHLSSDLCPSVLDRRALALDYWSSCRTICRIEKSKTDSKNKRNNRYCHYLKSLKVMCKSDTFNKLCESLC